LRHVSEDDVSALLELSAQVGELPLDVQARRAHVLNGLLGLVGGIHAQCSEADVATPGRYGLAIPNTTTQAGSWGEAQLAAMSNYLMSHEPAPDPCVPLMFQADGRVVVRRREEMMDRSWYRSEHYNLFRRAIGAGESLYCHVRMPAGRYFRIGIIREPRDRAYSERDVQVMRLFHENAARLYLTAPGGGAAAASADAPELAGLPPRLRPVLKCFLEGDAEKQAALKLGLSRHTVHEYAKILYRTLGVSSRGELMARFVTPQPAK
jgi:DNA-binding CsgD family transcriptional regulator